MLGYTIVDPIGTVMGSPVGSPLEVSRMELGAPVSSPLGGSIVMFFILALGNYFGKLEVYLVGVSPSKMYGLAIGTWEGYFSYS